MLGNFSYWNHCLSKLHKQIKRGFLRLKYKNIVKQRFLLFLYFIAHSFIYYFTQLFIVLLCLAKFYCPLKKQAISEEPSIWNDYITSGGVDSDSSDK